MNYLLDTHILIWQGISPNRLTQRVHQELLDPANTLFISDVSIREMEMKANKGKLDLGQSIDSFVAQQTQALRLNKLEIKADHISHLAEIAFYQV